jgi:HEPN domain-containing protein
MSRTKNRSEAERWLLTAEEDFKAAELLFEGAMYAQACFYAQQAGEKALKALWYMADAERSNDEQSTKYSTDLTKPRSVAPSTRC